MNKQRCFIAIKVEPVRVYFDFISTIRHDYDVNIRIVDPLNYHFTLHFFGELSEEQILQAHHGFQSIEFEKFELQLTKTDSFPTNNLPRTKVLVVSPKTDKKDMEAVAMIVRQIVLEKDFKTPTRKFTPHLTISRIKSGSQISEFTKNWLQTEFQPISLKCEKLTFMKSEQTSSGPRYHPLYEYELN